MRTLAFVFGIVLAAQQARAVNLTISASNASAGGSVEFSVSIYGIEAGGAAANNAQLDVLFDTNVFYVPADARRACQVAPRLSQLVHTESLPVSPPSPPGMQRLRLNVIDTIQPLGDVTDGDFYFCTLDVREDAPSGPTTLVGTRQQVGDTVGRPLPSNVGSATVGISGSGAADAIQPRAGGGGGGAVAPGLEIPAAAAGVAGRSGQPAEAVRSGGSTGIGSVARPANSGASAEVDAAPTAGVAEREPQNSGRDGRTPQVGSDALPGGRDSAAAAIAAANTPSPKATEASVPKATNTKAMTPTVKKKESVELEPTPEPKKSSWGCAIGADLGGESAIGGLLLVAGVLWGFRRRLPV